MSGPWNSRHRRVHAAAVVCLAALVAAAGCGTPPWKPFDCVEGGYSCMMPQEPVREVRVADTAVGSLEVVFNRLIYQYASFITSYVDYPEDYVRGTTEASILSGARDGAAAYVHGTIVSETRITQGAYPGREVVIVSADGKMQFRSRIFLAGRRLYQATAVVPATGAYRTDADRFLDSFTVTAKMAKLAGESAPWGEYKSPQGRFAVLTAGNPRFQTEPLSTEFGFLELHSFPFEDEGFSYVVSYTDYPEDKVRELGPTVVLNGIQSGMVQRSEGRATDVTDLTLPGSGGPHPGRQFVIVPKDERFRMQVRLYLAGARLYELVVVVPRQATNRENVDVFLKSFRLLQP